MKRFLFLFSVLFSILNPVAPAAVSVVGSLSRQSKAQPGGTFEGVIFLKNTGSRPAEARAFQTDYLFHADGTNQYGEPGSHPRSNGGWITLTPIRVKLGAGETVPVRYKGKVPADAELRGTYWSMIMIEPLAAEAEVPSGGEQKVAVGLQTKIRMGVQILTEVGRDAKNQLQVLEKSLNKTDGRRLLQVDLGNNGERMLTPAVNVELFDSNGASIGRFEGGRMRILPTCSVRSKVDLSDVPAGKYSAMVLLDAGGDQVMGAQYDLQIDP
jgi:hypothetical protein